MSLKTKVLEVITNQVSNHVLKIPKSKSEVEIRLSDGRTEFFKLDSTCPVEFIVREPSKSENGETFIDLEIKKFVVEAESKILWPGQKITMSGGSEITKEALPIYGRVTIPKGKSLIDGVESVQKVYLELDTPIGKLHNTQPIEMVGTITSIPPIGVNFRSVTETIVYDGKMIGQAVVAACGSTTVTD